MRLSHTAAPQFGTNYFPRDLFEKTRWDRVENRNGPNGFEAIETPGLPLSRGPGGSPARGTREGEQIVSRGLCLSGSWYNDHSQHLQHPEPSGSFSQDFNRPIQAMMNPVAF